MQPFLQLFYVLLPNFYVLLHLYAKFQVCQFLHLHHPQTSISPSPQNPVNRRFHRINSSLNQGQFCPTTHESEPFLCNTVQQSWSFLCNTVPQSGSFFVTSPPFFWTYIHSSTSFHTPFLDPNTISRQMIPQTYP